MAGVSGQPRKSKSGTRKIKSQGRVEVKCLEQEGANGNVLVRAKQLEKISAAPGGVLSRPKRLKKNGLRCEAR